VDFYRDLALKLFPWLATRQRPLLTSSAALFELLDSGRIVARCALQRSD